MLMFFARPRSSRIASCCGSRMSSRVAMAHCLLGRNAARRVPRWHNRRMAGPRIGITLGDPAGIGPEIVLKALASADRPAADYIVFGDMASLADRSARFG